MDPLATPPAFVDVPLRPRFFQSSAFFPMPIVLLSTRAEDGQANLAPYSLCFPHLVGEDHALVLVTRSASKTAANLVRTGRLCVCFLPMTRRSWLTPSSCRRRCRPR
ncbi:MAG: hypothetical protein U1F43_13125 [Myxococcota bacterium]